ADAVRRGEAEVVQRQLRDVGIAIELREVEPATALDLVNRADFDMVINNWTFGGASGDPDPGSTLLSTGLDNFSHWKNAEADRLIGAGRAETDPLKRNQIYRDLQKLVAEEVPFLFLMYWETVLLFSTRLKGMPERAANPHRLYADVRNYWI